MKRRILISVMSVLMLVTVYIATNVVLPSAGSRETWNESSKNEPEDENISVNYSDKCVVIDSGHEELTRVRRAAMAYWKRILILP